MKPTSIGDIKESTETKKDFNLKSLTIQADCTDQDQSARSVQSDLDLCRLQMYLYSPLALKVFNRDTFCLKKRANDNFDHWRI